MAESTVMANGITLWYGTFGDPADPALVLITGLGLQGIWWPTEFCERLAAGGHHVIRLDNREVGRSSYFGEDATYTYEDMADDVIGLLDALDIAQAHVVGASTGGAIAQWAAVRHPQRVLSLTSMMIGPYTQHEAAVAGLRTLTPETRQLFAEVTGGPPPETREARIQRGVWIQRAFWGTVPFEEDEVRAREAELIDRAWRPEATALQWAAEQRTPSRVDALTRLTARTLVIHGAADPLVPPDRGEATAALVPGAELVLIDGMGHSLPRACRHEIVDAILQHTAADPH